MAENVDLNSDIGKAFGDIKAAAKAIKDEIRAIDREGSKLAKRGEALSAEQAQQRASLTGKLSTIQAKMVEKEAQKSAETTVEKLLNKIGAGQIPTQLGRAKHGLNNISNMLRERSANTSGATASMLGGASRLTGSLSTALGSSAVFGGAAVAALGFVAYKIADSEIKNQTAKSKADASVYQLETDFYQAQRFTGTYSPEQMKSMLDNARTARKERVKTARLGSIVETFKYRFGFTEGEEAQKIGAHEEKVALDMEKFIGKHGKRFRKYLSDDHLKTLGNHQHLMNEYNSELFGARVGLIGEYANKGLKFLYSDDESYNPFNEQEQVLIGQIREKFMQEYIPNLMRYENARKNLMVVKSAREIRDLQIRSMQNEEIMRRQQRALM